MFVLPLWSFHIGFVGGGAVELGGRGDDAGVVPDLGRNLGPALVSAQPALRVGALPQGRDLVARPDLDRPLPDRLLGRRCSRRLRSRRRRGSPTGDFGVLARHVALVAGFAGAHVAANRAAPRVHALARPHAPPRQRRARHRAAAGIERRRQRRCASDRRRFAAARLEPASRLSQGLPSPRPSPGLAPLARLALTPALSWPSRLSQGLPSPRPSPASGRGRRSVILGDVQNRPLTKRKGGQSLKDHEANSGSRSTKELFVAGDEVRGGRADQVDPLQQDGGHPDPEARPRAASRTARRRRRGGREARSGGGR